MTRMRARFASMPRIVLAFGVVALALGCATTPARPGHPSSGPSAEDTVWAEVLDSLYVNARTRQLVVHDSTPDQIRSENMAAYAGAAMRGMPGVGPGTVDDFWERNREPRPVGPLPPTRVPVTLVTRADIASLPDGVDLHPNEPMRFWRAFHQRYPDSSGLISLSRVGFNAARTQAVLNVDRGCGGLCGDGTILLLARDAAGRWRVAATRGTWVS
jgi:hypothetical protein